MSTQQDKFTTIRLPGDKKPFNSFKNSIEKYLFHWPLFLGAIAVSAALGLTYLKIYKPVYEIKASLIIKDGKKLQNGKVDMLEEIGITNAAEEIENEIEILKSKQLIGQVVNDLGLWINYYCKKGLTSTDLYVESPVKFILQGDSQNLDNNKISIVIKDEKSFFLKMPDGSLKEILFTQPYHSAFGNWKLEPTKSILTFAGKTINIVLSSPESKALQYQKAIDASLANKLGTTIDLTISDKVAKRGEDILNSVVLNYNLSSSLERTRETKSTLDFLDQRIASLTTELSTSEKGIEGFKSSRGLTDISSESQIRLQNMQVNDEKLNEIKIKLKLIQGIEDYINSSQNSEKAPATLGISDPALSNSIEKLLQLQLQHDKLAATLPETNPDFDPINSQIKTTKAAIQENVKNIKASLEGTLAQLNTYNARFEASIKDIPSDERQYISIKRQQSSKENLYTYLLQKREEVSVKYAFTLTNTRVVDQAYASSSKNPSAMVYSLILLFGLGLPAALIYARGLLNNKITSINDIDASVQNSIIAEIPFEKTAKGIAIEDGKSTPFTEQIRTLRIKLANLYAGKENSKVILLTSSVSGEGKSFISANLASSFAQAYKKTIILEMDMRKPSIAKIFGMPENHVGVSEYLNEKAAITAIIQPSGINPNLDIITGGAQVKNASELLEKKQLSSLLAYLKGKYETIIIDSPPVHLVPDAFFLTRISDITLYVMRQGFTNKGESDFIKSTIDDNQLTNVKVVFNGIERVKYGYGYKYDLRYYQDNTRSNFLTSVFSDFKNRF